MKFRLDRMAKLQKQLKLTNIQLAANVGVTSKTIANYRKGLTIPEVVPLARLADALQTNVDYLMDRSDYPKPLSKLHYQVLDAYDRGSQSDLFDLLRKHMLKNSLGKNMLPGKKPGPAE